MDIRTWQEADRAADDPYRPRHRSGRSPFRPWRPGPIAVGSLSTAAVAAVAFATPGVMHVRTMPVDTRLDVAANHIGLLTPGSDEQSADAGSSPGTQAGTTSPAAGPTTLPGTQQTTGSHGTSGGTVKSASQAGTSHSGSTGSGASRNGHSGSKTASGNSAGLNGGGSTGSTGSKGSTGSTGSTSSTGSTGSTGTKTPSTTPASSFNAATATASAIHEIDAARGSAHLGGLRLDPTLTHAAIVHTSDMVTNGTFSHRGTDGSDPYGRAMRSGCLTFSKEIIARGNPGDDVIKTLLRDPSAYRALTSPTTQAIGVAAQQDPRTGQIVWTIELGWA